MELEEYFWDRGDNLWDAIFEPVGLTFENFKKMNVFAGTKRAKQYRQYEVSGFKTPSG
jgi:hypothetical protein